jgi:hypothetical protein
VFVYLAAMPLRIGVLLVILGVGVDLRIVHAGGA